MNIPNGFKMVPVEPTQAMLIAGYSEVPPGVLLCTAFGKMLSAAPTPPQPIYDEAKERELFESKFPVLPGILWDEDRKQYYGHSLYWLQQSQLDVWLACAQSRDKAVEVGHE